MTETQIKLIEAAEIEFAENGYEGASIRSITSRAEANIAAVNYHFGSKETLFIEMIRYRTEPINELRMERLDKAYEEANGKPISLRLLIDIIIRPLIGNLTDANGDKHTFVRAMGRGLTENRKLVTIMFDDILAEIIARITKSLTEILHDLDETQVSICHHYLSCALSGAMLQSDRSEFLSPKLDLQQRIDYLVEFIAGGIESIRKTCLNQKG